MSLIEKLDDLEKELDKQRLSFAKVMAIAASIMTVAGGGTAALVNGPKAEDTILTIIKLVGQDKDKEDEERVRLSPPPKALPDLTKKPQPFGADLENDAPF